MSGLIYSFDRVLYLVIIGFAGIAVLRNYAGMAVRKLPNQRPRQRVSAQSKGYPSRLIIGSRLRKEWLGARHREGEFLLPAPWQELAQSTSCQSRSAS